jgi:hypothetical protein
MTGIFHRRGAHRHHILWCVLALLWLFQQAAFAASVCAVSVPPMLVAKSASQPTCVSDMSAGHHAQRDMCAECTQGTPIRSDARSTFMPGSLLPPLAPAAPAVAVLPPAEESLASADQGHVYRPSLRLLFCSLLI